MRTPQSLLSERRQCALELHRESDLTARAMLQFRIDEIDRELHGRAEKASAVWSPAHGERQ